MRSRVTTLYPDIKIIICCSFCGYETRMTRAWKHSHAKFQCSGCGEMVSLVTLTPRTGLNDLWRKLSKIMGQFVCPTSVFPM